MDSASLPTGSTPPAPQSPWLSNPAWASGIVSDETRLWRVMLWPAAIFFAAMSVLPIVETLRVLVHPPPHFRLTLAVVLAPVILVGLNALLLGTAAWLSILRGKSGGSRFELATFPGAVGGQLAGTIVTGKPIGFCAPVHLALSCFDTSHAGRTGATRLWHEEQTLTSRLPADAHSTRIPVHFNLPPHCSPTQHGKKGIRWRLTAHSPMPGADYYATFIVPVFKAAHDSPVPDTAEEFRITDPPAEAPHGRGITLTDDAAGGVEIRFAAARHPGLAVQYTAFALIFGATPWILSWYGAGRIAVIAFGIVLGLIALIVGITAWGLWFTRSRVLARNKTLELTRGQLFFSRTLRFDAATITRFRIERTQETQHGTWYCLELHTTVPGHSTVVIADGLFKHDADRCLARLTHSLGLSPHSRAAAKA